jgi:hypothetical protein
VRGDSGGFLIGDLESGHAAARNTAQDYGPHAICRRSTELAEIDDAWAARAAVTVVSMAAGATGLITVASGGRRLGESASEGKCG